MVTQILQVAVRSWRVLSQIECTLLVPWPDAGPRRLFSVAIENDNEISWGSPPTKGTLCSRGNAHYTARIRHFTQWASCGNRIRLFSSGRCAQTSFSPICDRLPFDFVVFIPIPWAIVSTPFLETFASTTFVALLFLFIQYSLENPACTVHIILSYNSHESQVIVLVVVRVKRFWR